jgi:hypothetical protein
MTSPAPLQPLLEFSENYLGRPLQPEERTKLQNFYNQTILRQSARQTSAWHKQEIQRHVHETLMQLLSQVRQRLQKSSGYFAEKDATPAPEENAPESQVQMPSE